MYRPHDAVEAFLAAVEQLPAVRVEHDASCRSAQVRVRGRVIASIDLRCGYVVVHSPSHTLPALTRIFRSARATSDGLAFDVDDAPEALAAVRRRAHVERMLWQAQVASP